MEELAKKFKNFDLVISGIALTVLVLLTFVGVILRYFFNAPIAWQGEIQILCYIWLSYFGICAVVRNGGHVAIDIVVDALPKRAADVIDVFDFIITIAVLAYTAYQGSALVYQLYATNRVSGVLDIPYWIFYFPFPVGFALTVLNYLAAAWGKWGNHKGRGEGEQS